MRKPNILFLMSDEHRADVTGYEGNTVIRTPVLDELANSGVIFTSAYTPSPICIPGRQAMMSGKFPRHCGCERFGEDLPPQSMTFSRRLAQIGYETVVSGKLHHTGLDQMQGWTRRLFGDMHVSPKFLDEDTRSNRPPSPPDRKWSDAKEITRAGIGRGKYQAFDELSVQAAEQFISDYFVDAYYDRAENQPLLLKVSLLQPHYPYLTSEEKFNYYLNRVVPYEEGKTFNHPFLSKKKVKPGVDVTFRDLRRATAAYYGMIETIDELFGRVLRALEQVGQHLDDWVIIYTSDHGEMLGEHGIWEKQKFFEASARVPLIIRYPKRFTGGQVVTRNVNLCDLFATLCDLCGVSAPDDLDSRSVVPLMEGDAVGWDDESVSQYGATNLMIKQGQLKYQYYGDNIPEVLFDLERDPAESINFAGEARYEGRMRHFRERKAMLGFG